MNYPSDENAAILCRGLVKFTQVSVPTAVVIVNSYSHNCSYTAKAFGLRTSTTFLGCPSCITVTKECYQIGFLESSLRDFSTLAIVSFFRRPTFLAFPPQPCNQGTLSGVDV